MLKNFKTVYMVYAKPLTEIKKGNKAREVDVSCISI